MRRSNDTIRPPTPNSIRACNGRSSNYASNEAPGTVIIDTPHTFLYYVLGNGKAIRYGIGVGRQGFTWSGVKQVARRPSGRIGIRRPR